MMNPPIEIAELPALVALLEERHVTRAAERLGITQSSMSHRLHALRTQLGDELLVRARDGYVLTPRAQALLPPLRETVDRFEQALLPDTFDPATCELTVKMAVPDLLAPFLPGLTRLLFELAPRLRLEVAAVGADMNAALEDGRTWLAVAPEPMADERLVLRNLGALAFGVVARSGHPAFRGQLSVEKWLKYPHAVVSVGHAAPNRIDDALRRLKKERRVGLVVQGFLSGLVAVAQSDLLMNAPLPLATEVTRLLGIETRALPIDVPPVRFALMWHERFRRDPAHLWFRDLTFEYLSAATKRVVGRRRPLC